MRYIVFAGNQFYPAGGALDIVGTQGIPEVAIRLACRHLGMDSARWSHVYDTLEKRIIWKDGLDVSESEAVPLDA